MWDQWLQSMGQEPAPSGLAVEGLTETKPSTVAVSAQPKPDATPRGRFVAILHLLEWWRWSLIAGGLLCIVTGLILLVQSGQADVGLTTDLTAPTGNSVELLDLGQTQQQLGATASARVATASSAVTSASQLIYVDVAGAVVDPGVHELEQSARAGAAVAAAGGLTRSAHQLYMRKYFNSAAPIHDGEKIYIPFESEAIESFATAGGSTSVTSSSTSTANSSSTVSDPTVVSINAATSNQLDTLPGIGAVRAEQIIAGRPYQRLEELQEKSILTANIYAGLTGLTGLISL